MLIDFVYERNRNGLEVEVEKVKRRGLIAAAMLLLIGGAGYVLFSDDGESANKDSTEQQSKKKRSGPQKKSASRASSKQSGASRGPEIAIDDDPIGTLRLEGQVSSRLRMGRHPQALRPDFPLWANGRGLR